MNCGICSDGIPKHYHEQQEHVHAIQEFLERTAILPPCKSQNKTRRAEMTKISSLLNPGEEKLIYTSEIRLGEERKRKQNLGFGPN